MTCVTLASCINYFGDMFNKFIFLILLILNHQNIYKYGPNQDTKLISAPIKSSKMGL